MLDPARSLKGPDGVAASLLMLTPPICYKSRIRVTLGCSCYFGGVSLSQIFTSLGSIPMSEVANSSDKSSSRAWYEDECENDSDDYPVDQYNISASPNDFNITTIFNFIGSGARSVSQDSKGIMYGI